MNLKIDFHSGIPVYVQIMEHIRQLVAAGELKPGDQLPTVRQMAADLRVNWNTVARAYRLLDQAGLISTQHGRGTYIWGSPGDESHQQVRAESLRGLTRRFLEEAYRLGGTPDEIAELVGREIQGSAQITSRSRGPSEGSGNPIKSPNL